MLFICCASEHASLSGGGKNQKTENDSAVDDILDVSTLSEVVSLENDVNDI